MLAAGLLARWYVPGASVPACGPDPDGSAAFNAQAQADARHAQLQAELAGLVNEEGRRRLQCPLPAAAPPAPPPQRAETPPPALPQDRWNRHDLSLLEGCWSRITNMTIEETATGAKLPVSSWRICFDAHGSGTQTIVLQDGTRCAGPLRATFADDQMVTDAARAACHGRISYFVRSRQECVRTSDEEAECEATDLEGPHAGRRGGHSRFRR
jgi:hypothetical protein